MTGRQLLQRVRRTPAWAVDTVLGTAIVLSGVLSTAVPQSEASLYEDRDALAWLLILAGTVPFYVRRRTPAAVLVVISTAITVLMMRGNESGALPLAVIVGAYTVAAYRPARVVVASAAYLALLLVVILLGDAPEFGVGEMLSSGGMFAAAFFVGWVMQTRGQRIEAFDREQAEAALRAAADERLRIAQEVHDVVAHSLGVIAVQAAAGMHVIDSEPDEARQSLETISRMSRSSLAEIRQLLGVVRKAEGRAAYRPTPGLADLPRLARDVTATGLSVEVDVAGEVGDVPPGVGLAAYRITQEALTNVVRHAGARRATVRLDSQAGMLTLEVTDDGRGPSGRRSGGHGLVGMRERVAVYGGTFTTGVGPDGGFRVAAELPYEAVPVW